MRAAVGNGAGGGVHGAAGIVTLIRQGDPRIVATLHRVSASGRFVEEHHRRQWRPREWLGNVTHLGAGWGGGSCGLLRGSGWPLAGSGAEASWPLRSFLLQQPHVLAGIQRRCPGPMTPFKEGQRSGSICDRSKLSICAITGSGVARVLACITDGRRESLLCHLVSKGLDAYEGGAPEVEPVARRPIVRAGPCPVRGTGSTSWTRGGSPLCYVERTPPTNHGGMQVCGGFV